jgi:hypothetical protein
LTRVEDLVELDPALVEELVLLATDASTPPMGRRYRRERDGLYAIADGERREAAFRDLDARWFRSLGLAKPLVDLLGEFEPVLARISRCIVLHARRRRDEGADLHAGRGNAPALAVKLTPASLLDWDRTVWFLRSELLHVEDMLDPAFGYARDPALRDNDPVYEKLVRDRYRVLWNTSVDGRLRARGCLPAEFEARSRREFLAAFSMLGSEVDDRFQKLFHGPRPSHAELLSFAVDVEGQAAGRCALCRFPTARFRGPGLGPPVEDAIRRDFPQFLSSDGICVQCADLYEARASSGVGTARES